VRAGVGAGGVLGGGGGRGVCGEEGGGEVGGGGGGGCGGGGEWVCVYVGVFGDGGLVLGEWGFCFLFFVLGGGKGGGSVG